MSPPTPHPAIAALKSNPGMPPPVRVVFDDSITARKHDLLPALLEAGVGVTISGADGDQTGAVAPLDDSTLVILRDASGDEDCERDENGIPVRVRGIADLDTPAIVAMVRAEAEVEPGEWKPWFPVIDYDRCTNCMQCLSFCLFGVYDVDDEKQIDVAQPHRCKTNCPACSRVCPEVAILFPKYRNGPINGDVVKDEDLSREKMKTDISSILGGDIYSLLRKRHERAQSRFSKERDESRALKERQRCLVALKEQFDIPDEVLAELPTAEAIQEKAAARIQTLEADENSSSPSNESASSNSPSSGKADRSRD